jgi:hypothetical protein
MKWQEDEQLEQQGGNTASNTTGAGDALQNMLRIAPNAASHLPEAS